MAPAERFAMLDEGLESADPQERALCVDALANAFRRDSTRFDESGRIGTREKLIDWAPATRDDVDAFHQEALERLVRTRKERPELAERCEAILARAVRAALSGDRYLAFAQILRDISEEKGFWPEAVESVGSWLFFDRRPEASERGTFVRRLYDELFPSDPVDRAIVFTKFWRANIRDPDIRYSEDDRDHGYANRAARALAIEIAGDPDAAIEAVRRMSALDLKEVFDFAEELAANASDKLGLIEAAVDTLIAVGPGTGNASVLRGLLRGTDRLDRDAADRGAQAAQERLDPAQWPLVNLHSAISIDGKRLARILTDIESGLLEPQHCIMLSYGRGLDELDPSDIARLALTLTTKGSEGAWAALEIAMMYRHGANVPAEHRHLVALLLGAPVLLASGHDRDRDAHLLGELATSVRATVGIDRPTAQAWCDQVIRLAVADDGAMLFALDSAMRKIVGLVREDMPDVAWGKFSHFYAAATPIERNRLKRLVGSEEDRFEGQAHTDAGPLFGVSEQSMFDWADEAEDGPSFLLDFYPILEKSGGDAAWHPALVTLVQRYGKSKPFLAALSRRIRPSSWSGSVVPLLEVFLNPLRGWFDHPLRLVQIWAQEEYRRIERRIDREKEHDREWMG
ncbi:hypothetical protein [uncultured Devosia sp.]|uniref:hypothetical protein n=1 Tax=uncultured Devosia sp. TaxID=211434 RepID=UPI0035CC6D11